MRNRIVIASLISCFAGSAMAADLPTVKEPSFFSPTPAFSWTGFYGGINGGYSWSHANYDFDGGPFPSVSGHGEVVGGDFGYNVQLWGNFVIGGEGNFSWSHISGDNDLGAAGFYHTDIDWIASATARVGYAFDRVLVFADGGGALGGVNHSNADFPGDAGSLATYSTVNPGWTAGAGVEYAFTDHLTGNVNYKYYDLGSQGSPTTLVDDGFFWTSHTLRVTTQAVTAGVNYKF